MIKYKFLTCSWTFAYHVAKVARNLKFVHIRSAFAHGNDMSVSILSYKRQLNDSQQTCRSTVVPNSVMQMKIRRVFFGPILWNSLLDLVHDRQFVHIRELSVIWENYRLYKRIVCHIDRFVCHNKGIQNNMSFTRQNWDQQKF